jgi:hypothetical protein
VIGSHSGSFKEVVALEFKATNYIVWTAKKLVTEIRILSNATVKPGKVLLAATAEVNQFYECDEISRIMLGTKDYVSVISEAKKVHL